MAEQSSRFPSWSGSGRWSGTVVGSGCAALGAVLLFRPFESLTALVIVVAVGAFLLAAGVLAGRRDEPRRWPVVAAGTLWIAVGVVVAPRPTGWSPRAA